MCNSALQCVAVCCSVLQYCDKNKNCECISNSLRPFFAYDKRACGHKSTPPPHPLSVRSHSSLCVHITNPHTPHTHYHLCILNPFTSNISSFVCTTLQHTATHCDTLQHPATHCNTLQHTATRCFTVAHCITLQRAAIMIQFVI